MIKGGRFPGEFRVAEVPAPNHGTTGRVSMTRSDYGEGGRGVVRRRIAAYRSGRVQSAVYKAGWLAGWLVHSSRATNGIGRLPIDKWACTSQIQTMRIIKPKA